MWRKLSLDKQIPSPKNKRPDGKKSQKEVKNKSTNDRKETNNLSKRNNKMVNDEFLMQLT